MKKAKGKKRVSRQRKPARPRKPKAVVAKVTNDTITVASRRPLSKAERKRIYEMRRDGEPLFRIGQHFSLTPEEVGLVLAEPIAEGWRR